MSKKLFVITLAVCLFFVLGVSPAYAAEPEPVEVETPGLYTPRLLPGHPLYFVKNIWERVRLTLTFDKVANVKYQIRLTEKRIAEANALVKKGKPELAEKSIERYRTRIDQTLTSIREAKEKGEDVDDLVARLTENALRHEKVMARVYEKVPEPARKAIEKAIEVSKRGYEEAIEAIKSPAKRQELIEKAKKVGQVIKEKARELPGILQKKLEEGLEKLEEKVKEMEEIKESEKLEEEVEKIEEKAEGVKKAVGRFSSPQATLDTLFKAFETRDLNLYMECISQKSLKAVEAELQIKLAKDTSTWTTGQVQMYKDANYRLGEQGDAYAIMVPKNYDNPAIGNFYFEKENGLWKIDILQSIEDVIKRLF